MAIYGDDKHNSDKTEVSVNPKKNNLIQINGKGFFFRGKKYATIELAMKVREEMLKKEKN